MLLVIRLLYRIYVNQVGIKKAIKDESITDEGIILISRLEDKLKEER
jgi:hypothetical protein